MKQVSINSIQKAIEKVDNLNDEGLEKLAETYALAQPVLLGYVLSAAQEYQNQKLEGLLVYYFCLISEAFTQEQIQVNQIYEDTIDEFEPSYFEALGEFFEKENDEMLLEISEQPEIIKFMLIEISTDDEDGTSLDEETGAQLFIVMSAMISLMGQSAKA